MALSRFELLIGSSEFWARAARDIAAARSRVLVQAMTFEGDRAGLEVAQAIGAASAGDRRVLVDDYTRHVLNDTFLMFSRDAALAAEAKRTWAMFDELKSNGVGLRITNPVGTNPFRYAARNHKKLLIMDDVAWLGGINFSDHNFAWHDAMLRIADPQVAQWLAEQFQADWQGNPGFARAEFGPDLQIESYDGVSNAPNVRGLLKRFAEAESSIDVLSAYPTMPFTGAMAKAAARGAKVTIYTPRPNNKPIVRDYLLGIASDTGIRLAMTDSMTHVKAALIDGDTLLLGSSNFDFVSCRLNSEYVAVLRDRALIEDFRRRLLDPVKQGSTPPLAHEMRGWGPLKARLALEAAAKAIRLVRPGKRVTEWRRP